MQQKSRFSTFQTITFAILAVLIIAFFYVAKNENKPKEEAQSAPDLAQTSVEPTQTVDRSNLIWSKNQTVKAAILMYHHIGPLPSDADDIRRDLTVSLENFEQQMKYLKQNSFNVLTMKEMYGLVAEGKLPAKTVILTFDDGYQDNYLYAEPVLESYGFKATFNIITGDIGQTDYMTQEEITALLRQGNELASHTVSHPSLDQLTGAKLQAQLVDSKTELEKITGQKVITLCYPAGKYNAEVESDAKAAGYKMAITTEASKGTFSTSKPFEIPRYRINPTTNLSSLIK